MSDQSPVWPVAQHLAISITFWVISIKNSRYICILYDKNRRNIIAEGETKVSKCRVDVKETKRVRGTEAVCRKVPRVLIITVWIIISVTSESPPESRLSCLHPYTPLDHPSLQAISPSYLPPLFLCLHFLHHPKTALCSISHRKSFKSVKSLWFNLFGMWLLNVKAWSFFR